MKLVTKTLWQLLMKKKNMENYKKALEWWIVKELMLKKLTWLKKEKKNIDINEVIKHNEIINNILKPKIIKWNLIA